MPKWLHRLWNGSGLSLVLGDKEICVDVIGPASSSILADEISAMQSDRAFLTFRFAALANRLPVFLQQQVGTLPRVKLLENLSIDQRLGLTVCDRVALPLQPVLNANQHMRTIRGHRRNRRNLAEEQNPIRTGIRNVRETS